MVCLNTICPHLSKGSLPTYTLTRNLSQTALTPRKRVSGFITGFKKCGIVPYNPDVFEEADFTPSEVTDIPIDPVPTNTESYSVNVSSTSIDLCDGRNIGLDAAGLPEMPESLPAQPIDVAQPSSPEDANSSFTIISPVELLPMPKAAHTRQKRKS
ncbi:unnamed protein product [Clavelina lepadiformis]|uniref:Uncharacterized protein n=1 Tax=Clavelina lepadiformis TaxID=159417 RepID=A0ABP0GG89_CLALP